MLLVLSRASQEEHLACDRHKELIPLPPFPLAMEGFHDMHCNGDILSPKKTKNRLKTPEQVQALEEVYSEDKYPSETLKSELANRIGLSHKQVSRWFFHRRMKDKKLFQNDVSGNGRQNVSDSLINDHSSGIEQESCSSNKQGDLHLNPKDIESKRWSGHHSSMEVIVLQKKASCARLAGSVCSDLRCGPSLELQERERQHDKISRATKFCSNFFGVENLTLANRRISKSKEVIMNSRSYSFKAGMENRAISSIKRKLGEFYCEEGPPLGVHFDPLPPGAFGSIFAESSTEPRQTRDVIQCNPQKQRKVIREHEVHDNFVYKKYSNASHTGRGFFRENMQGPHHSDGSPILQLNRKACLANHTSAFQDQTSQVEDFGRYIIDSNCSGVERCHEYQPKGIDKSTKSHFLLHDQDSPTKAFSYLNDRYNCDSLVSKDEISISNREFLRPATKSTYFQQNGNMMLTKRNSKNSNIIKQSRFDHSYIVDQDLLMITEPRKRSKFKNVSSFNSRAV